VRNVAEVRNFASHRFRTRMQKFRNKSGVGKCDYGRHSYTCGTKCHAQ